MIVYKDELLKKSSNRKSKLVLSTLVTTWLSNIAFHLRPILLEYLVAIDSESRLKLLHAAIWSRFAVQFESEHMPLSRTGRQFRPAALHRIWFGTSNFVQIVPMSYSYSETNYWSQDWAKRWALLWSATTSRQFQKSNSSLPEIHKALKPCWHLNWVSFSRVVA